MSDKILRKGGWGGGNLNRLVYIFFVVFVCFSYYCPYVLYLAKMETSKLYMFDCCAARPYALLLFGGDLVVNHMKKLITIDGFINFQCSSRVAALIEGLRKLLDNLLLQIFSDPEVYFISFFCFCFSPSPLLLLSFKKVFWRELHAIRHNYTVLKEKKKTESF